MTNPLTINQVFAQLAALEGQPVELEAVLVDTDGDGFELLHYPAAERVREFVDDDREYPASILLGFGNGSLRPNVHALRRWSGKRVRVHGVIHSVLALPPVSGLSKGGFGPWGLWPAEVEVYSVQRVTADERRESARQ